MMNLKIIFDQKENKSNCFALAVFQTYRNLTVKKVLLTYAKVKTIRKEHIRCIIFFK